MRGAAASMTVLRPRTAAEALKLYARTPEAVPLAGGTDFMVGWNAGLANGRVILDLTALEAWTRIHATKSQLSIGALATHAELQAHASLRRHLPLLVQACATVGGLQIQNRGTLGGNIANASPAGDTFPPLAVYDAVVEIVSSRGRRRVPFVSVFAGVKRTVLEPGELIQSVAVPLPRRPTRGLWRKVGTRAAQAISKTMAAGLLWLGRDGRVEELRFALGSMAPTVRRLASVEAHVKGQRLTREVVREACELLKRDVSPIDDVRSTAEYRLAVSQNLLASFLTRES
jgi:CO/xanthine dehydrogenase FAD-binding subunit